MISLPPVVAARRNSFEKIFAYELPQFGCALVLQYEICLTIYGVVTGGAPLCEIKGLKIFICTVSSFNCFCSPQRLQFVAVISFFFPVCALPCQNPGKHELVLLDFFENAQKIHC